MMDKKQVQAAIGRIDQVTAQLNMNREAHVQLANDIRLVQSVCEQFFNERDSAKKEEPEDGGTNIIPLHAESSSEDIERGGDSV
jgi:hypothetical protein